MNIVNVKSKIARCLFVLVSGNSLLLGKLAKHASFCMTLHSEMLSFAFSLLFKLAAYRGKIYQAGQFQII